MDEIALSGPPAGQLENWVWSQLVGGAAQPAFEAALGRAIVTRRWFGAKTRSIRSVEIANAIPLGPDVRLILVEIEFNEGPAEYYQIPLAIEEGARAERLLADHAVSAWARLLLGGGHGAAGLFDGLHDEAVCRDLLQLIEADSRLAGMMDGELVAWKTTTFDPPRNEDRMSLIPRLVAAEQSNSSVVYGERLILKLFRRVEAGLNPDLEMNAYLTERGFAHVPPLLGAIEYRRSQQEPWAVAMLQGFVPNQGDAWQYTLARLDGFFESMIEPSIVADDMLQLPSDGIIGATRRALPSAVSRAFGAFLFDAQRLGTRTAELHLALAAETENPAFRPEPFASADQQALHQRCQRLADEVFGLLRGSLAKMPERTRSRAQQVAGLEAAAREQLQRVMTIPIRVQQIRCHGDYHLGQLLVTERDFVILDFEGEPARPLGERRKKQLALRDVAGMIRSYHYASCSAAARALRNGPLAEARSIERAAQAWYVWISVAFLSAYRQTAAGAVFLPASDEEFERLIETCLLEKALYELRYELNNRPDWVDLPLQALIDLLVGEPTQG